MLTETRQTEYTLQVKQVAQLSQRYSAADYLWPKVQGRLHLGDNILRT